MFDKRWSVTDHNDWSFWLLHTAQRHLQWLCYHQWDCARQLGAASGRHMKWPGDDGCPGQGDLITA